MGWKPLSFVRSGKHEQRNAPVTLSGVAGSGRRTRPRIVLIIRTHQDDALHWLEPKARVAVLLGDGEHSGMLRVELDPTSREALGRPGGKHNAGIVMLNLPWPPGVTAANQRSQPVRFHQVNGGLEIHLPTWARTAATVKATGAVAVAPAPETMVPVEPALAGALNAANAARSKAGLPPVGAKAPFAIGKRA